MKKILDAMRTAVRLSAMSGLVVDVIPLSDDEDGGFVISMHGKTTSKMDIRDTAFVLGLMLDVAEATQKTKGRKLDPAE